MRSKFAVFSGVVAAVAGLTACGAKHSSKRSGAVGTGEPTVLTYFHDVKPLIDQNCMSCHQAGGIAPFSLQQPDEVVAHQADIVEAVASRAMPPWPAAHNGTEYLNDPSLTEAQIATIKTWADGGAPLGDAASQGAPLTALDHGLAHVDLSIKMAQPYTPTIAPDEYRCFVLDWPKEQPMYVTGFGVTPGNRAIVHHLIAYRAPASAAADLARLTAGSKDNGYTCFGGARIDSAEWLGVWAPGMQASDYPKDTGIRIEPGAKIILQVHYNLQNLLEPSAKDAPKSDQTSVQFSLAPAVKTPALIIGWDDDHWTADKSSLLIPANAPDTMHSFSADPTPFIGGRSLTILGAFDHMHQLGKSSELRIDHPAGKDVLVSVPQWDFHWQLQYWLKTPKTVRPGDKLTIECHWDNTQANQPVINGVQQTPRDVTWGDGSTDEMCFATFYAVMAD